RRPLLLPARLEPGVHDRERLLDEVPVRAERPRRGGRDLRRFPVVAPRLREGPRVQAPAAVGHAPRGQPRLRPAQRTPQFLPARHRGRRKGRQRRLVQGPTQPLGTTRPRRGPEGPGGPIMPGNLRAFTAEMIGTFALIFIGAGSVCIETITGKVGLTGIALAHGLTILAMAAALGPVSGGHFNP